MAGLYIKLDHNWLKDPKVRNFKREAGKAGCLDLLQLFICLSRNNGRIDLKDYGQKADMIEMLGIKEARLNNFLSLVADCNLIDKEMFETCQIVISQRAVKDAEARTKRSESGRIAGKASGEARRAKG